jgi:tRNA(Ile)-lysidine synthetase-like protein
LPYGAGEIELRVLNSNHTICDTVKEDSQFTYEIADLSLEVLSASGTRLQVRNWRPGDGLVRAGHQKPEKIKSLFQESRILIWQRRHWPVAITYEEIVWTKKFGPSAKYVAGPESRIARLTYRRRKDSEWL